METKKEKVMRYLKRLGKISLLESINFCGDSHLHRTIKSIERDGYMIKRNWIDTNKKRSYMEYELVGKIL